MKSIGIDLGVSFIKIGFLTQDGLSDVKRVSAPVGKNQSSWACELDAGQFVTLVKGLVDEYLNKDRIIEGIYFSTQMHGFVLYDPDSGERSPYISWKDRRAEKYKIGSESSIQYLNRTLTKDLIAATGMKLRSGLPSVNLFVLQQQKKLSSRFYFGTIADYVVSILTNTRASTSLTNAAGSGLFDIQKNDWNHELIERLGIEVSLPELKLERTAVGRYSGINVYSPIGDQQAAVLGIGKINYSDTAVSNIATGSQATLISSQMQLSDDFQTRPFVDGKYLLTIPFIPAGRVLNSLILFLAEVGSTLFLHEVKLEETWEKVAQYIDTFENLETDLVVDSDFIGSFSNDGGSICHINEDNFNLKSILLGFFDNIVDNHAKFLMLLNQHKPFDKVILTGGVSQKVPLIKYLLERKIRQKISQSLIEEDALNGLRCIAFTDIQRW